MTTTARDVHANLVGVCSWLGALHESVTQRDAAIVLHPRPFPPPPPFVGDCLPPVSVTAGDVLDSVKHAAEILAAARDVIGLFDPDVSLGPIAHWSEPCRPPRTA
jgi:hypothetical protein